MSMLIINLVSKETKEVVKFFSALNCAQMEIKEFGSVETLDNKQVDVVFENLTEKQQETVLEMFTLCDASFTHEVK